MATVERRAESVRRRIEIFRAEQQGLQADHDVAMVCFELEELLADGICLYRSICRLDEQWHLKLLSHATGYREDVTEQLRKLFADWNAAGDRLLANLAVFGEEYVRRGFDVVRLDEFRQVHQDCTALLNPSDCETDLADVAIAEFRSGRTEEVQ